MREFSEDLFVDKESSFSTPEKEKIKIRQEISDLGIKLQELKEDLKGKIEKLIETFEYDPEDPDLQPSFVNGTPLDFDQMIYEKLKKEKEITDLETEIENLKKLI